LPNERVPLRYTQDLRLQTDEVPEDAHVVVRLSENDALTNASKIKFADLVDGLVF
jgi:hypothetical protein